MEKEAVDRLNVLARGVYRVALAEYIDDAELVAFDKEPLNDDVRQLLAAYITEEERLALVTSTAPVRPEVLDFLATVGLHPGPWRAQAGFLPHPKSGKPAFEVVNAANVVVWRFATAQLAKDVVKALNDGATELEVVM